MRKRPMGPPHITAAMSPKVAADAPTSILAGYPIFRKVLP